MTCIAGGLISPLVDCTPYLKGVYKGPGESNRDYAQLWVSNPQAEQRRNKRISVFLVNESKLSPEELAQLYCRRFAFCDTNVFKCMYAKELISSCVAQRNQPTSDCMLDKSASRALEVQGSVVGHAQRAYFSSCGGGTRVVPGAVTSYINEDIQSDPEVGDMAEEIPIVDIEDIQSDPEMGYND